MYHLKTGDCCQNVDRVIRDLLFTINSASECLEDLKDLAFFNE